ncbi:hypothetical protein [Haloparvum sedimenti]|uniref:hypothetical protein n=1 Tax=Haloparvum sedimenti TaxID=1678448 RepID=UPI00071E7712|nr:hypothetical protein [Haloparvum sedimenti]
MVRSPSPRSLLLVGSFALLVALTVGGALSTSAAVTAHMEASTSVEAQVAGIEPADGGAVTVRLRVENPTEADMRFDAAWLPVSDGEEVVASTAGRSIDPVAVPAGETVTFGIRATGEDVSTERLHAAAEADRLSADGRLTGTIVDRTVNVDVTDDRAAAGGSDGTTESDDTSGTDGADGGDDA